MRLICAILLAILLAAFYGERTPQRGVRSEEMARWAALGMIESGDDDRAIGPDGEVSRWQILPSEWRHYTRLPLSAATNPFTALRVAERIMESRTIIHLCRGHCGAVGASIPDYNWALLWHCPGRLNDPSARDRDFAERFENLCGAMRVAGKIHEP